MAKYYKIKNGKRGDEIDVIQAQHLRSNEYERVEITESWDNLSPQEKRRRLNEAQKNINKTF